MLCSEITLVSDVLGKSVPQRRTFGDFMIFILPEYKDFNWSRRRS